MGRNAVRIRRRVFTGGVAFGALAAVHGLGACGGDDTGADAGPGPGGDDLSDVIYEAGASDEALVALLAAQAVLDDQRGTRFSAPADGAVLASSTPQSFEWYVGSSARVTPPHRVPWWRRAARVLGPGVAHAHGAPVNGRAYFLGFASATQPKLLRVFTTRLDYLPDAAAWAKLAAAEGAITARIVSAIFETNRIVEDGGPFLGRDVEFSLE
jgi:hypothetical protein